MPLFHVNESFAAAGLCSNPVECRIADEDSHYTSAEAATDAYRLNPPLIGRSQETYLDLDSIYTWASSSAVEQKRKLEDPDSEPIGTVAVREVAGAQGKRFIAKLEDSRWYGLRNLSPHVLPSELEYKELALMHDGKTRIIETSGVHKAFNPAEMLKAKPLAEAIRTALESYPDFEFTVTSDEKLRILAKEALHAISESVIFGGKSHIYLPEFVATSTMKAISPTSLDFVYYRFLDALDQAAVQIVYRETIKHVDTYAF